jgi:4-amino-4-deoxy-L-arabinose transferase-like glycosyltransferase
MKKALWAAATSLSLILVVALGSRLGFAWDQGRKIPADVVGTVPFLHETGNIAYSLALGKGFSSVFRKDTGPTAWLTPVYPLLLAGIFQLFGIFTARSFFVAVFLNILFSTAACVPIFYVGKRVSRIGVASGAAWLWAIFPNAIVIPFEWIWDTSLSALLAATILWATLELAESQRLRHWCGYGLLWGFTLMTNPALGSLLPLLLGWAACRDPKQGLQRFRKPALAALIIILCCLPWTIRNFVAFYRFIPLRSNLPFELWLGNNEVFDEDSPNVMARITTFGEIRRYTELGETAYLQEKWQKAIQFIRAHPGLAMRLSGRRFVATWVGRDSPLKHFLETDSLFIKAVLLANLFVAIGALFGLVVLYRRRRALTFPIAVFPVVFPCLYYVTHASLRYRHPIDPVVLLLTAIAAEPLFQLLARRGRVKPSLPA